MLGFTNISVSEILNSPSRLSVVPWCALQRRNPLPSSIRRLGILPLCQEDFSSLKLTFLQTWYYHKILTPSHEQQTCGTVYSHHCRAEVHPSVIGSKINLKWGKCYITPLGSPFRSLNFHEGEGHYKLRTILPPPLEHPCTAWLPFHPQNQYYQCQVFI